MKNWKTTLAGAIAGGLIAVQPLLATGAVDWKSVAVGFVVAAFGYFAKDAGVSGTDK